MTTDQPRIYRLTRPDGLGFFRRHSATQFALGCGGIGLDLLAIVGKILGTPGRIGVAVAGAAIVALAVGRTPSGEDLLDLLSPFARSGWRHVRRREQWAAVIAPVRGDTLPPLFAGISLVDFTPDSTDNVAREQHWSNARVGLIVDRADGSVSVMLRAYGEGFLLCDPLTQDERVASFGAALASLGREESPIRRVAWSQFAAPSLFDEHHSYLQTTQRTLPDEAMHDAYLELVDEALGSAMQTEVCITLTANIAETTAKRSSASNERSTRAPQRLQTAALRLLEEAELFASELHNAGLSTTSALPASSIARVLRERLDPSVRRHLSRRGRSLVDALGLVTPENGFPLLLEEHARSMHVDDSWHRLLRIAEWPRSGVRADWLSAFLCERDVTRSFTVVFTPLSRRLARRQALAVATRVGANIDERESKGRRVGAEERRAQLAAEALDEELEAGAEMELVLGLVDVCAPSEDELEQAVERTIQVGADSGLELRTVALRQAEALVASLPIGRVVLGRAK